ncbi:MAG: GNAT family N-acetyltransferase [Rhodobiaceae bacterium]|nr:GNAT family N-acetyltransferase [Rhodobiaceae bacterium]MCC0015902.1 GNAT family N-acetyltransferase [Rhodobiaceae bacterium]MCC0040687.1 GNAT family N-acetyltransferase [Rhodobiaceae bacterium]
MDNKASAHLCIAQTEDLDALVAMVRALNAEDGHPVEGDLHAPLSTLLAEPALGCVFLIEVAGKTIGYAILCHGFSVEYGGRDCFLDEIYIAPGHRTAGHGREALRQLEAWARDEGICAMHLEVMPGNPAARLYERTGFRDRNSRFMSKRLAQT